MNAVVLRVWSRQPGWDPEAFLRDYLPDVQAPWWRADDAHAGRMRGEAGFNVAIRPSSDVADDVIAWVHQHRLVLRALQSADVLMEVDIGLFAGSDDQFTASVVFTSDQLQVLVESGIDVKISAYPVASEPK